MRCLLIMILLLPGFASAEIYRWTDAQGRVHFGQQPGATGAQTVTVKPQVVERDDATLEREQRTRQYFDARREEKAQAEARTAQMQAERGRECSELRNRLEQIQRGGRYFVTDQNGERNYIDESEIEAARSRLTARIAGRCG